MKDPLGEGGATRLHEWALGLDGRGASPTVSGWVAEAGRRAPILVDEPPQRDRALDA